MVADTRLCTRVWSYFPSHFMPYLKSKGHPTINDQQTMAKSLIEFIDSNIEW